MPRPSSPPHVVCVHSLSRSEAWTAVGSEHAIHTVDVFLADCCSCQHSATSSGQNPRNGVIYSYNAHRQHSLLLVSRLHLVDVGMTPRTAEVAARLWLATGWRPTTAAAAAAAAAARLQPVIFTGRPLAARRCRLFQIDLISTSSQRFLAFVWKGPCCVQPSFSCSSDTTLHCTYAAPCNTCL